MADESYDLWYDPNTVGADLVALCWIAHGTRSADESFSPVAGDAVLVGDGEEPALSARVIKREGDRVWAQLHLLDGAAAVA